MNHCALYLGAGEFAHVGRHIPDPYRVGLPIQPAARTECLVDWLVILPGPHDRTVTALRHGNVKSPSDASTIVARARTYIDLLDTTYDYVSLISLMVPSLLRTYTQRSGSAEAGGEFHAGGITITGRRDGEERVRRVLIREL